MEGFDVDEFFKEMCPVLKNGWLWKKKQRGVTLGGWVPYLQWQQRYFMYDNERSQLCYGPNPEHAHKRNIRFDEIEFVCLSRAPVAHEGARAKLVAKGLQFEVHLKNHAHHHNNNRVFVFQSDTSSDADAWVRLLKKASLKFNPETRHKNRSFCEERRRGESCDGEIRGETDLKNQQEQLNGEGEDTQLYGEETDTRIKLDEEFDGGYTKCCCCCFRGRAEGQAEEQVSLTTAS